MQPPPPSSLPPLPTLFQSDYRPSSTQSSSTGRQHTVQTESAIVSSQRSAGGEAVWAVEISHTPREVVKGQRNAFKNFECLCFVVNFQVTVLTHGRRKGERTARKYTDEKKSLEAAGMQPICGNRGSSVVYIRNSPNSVTQCCTLCIEEGQKQKTMLGWGCVRPCFLRKVCIQDQRWYHASFA